MFGQVIDKAFIKAVSKSTPEASSAHMKFIKKYFLKDKNVILFCV